MHVDKFALFDIQTKAGSLFADLVETGAGRRTDVGFFQEFAGYLRLDIVVDLLRQAVRTADVHGNIAELIIKGFYQYFAVPQFKPVSGVLNGNGRFQIIDIELIANRLERLEILHHGVDGFQEALRAQGAELGHHVVAQFAFHDEAGIECAIQKRPDGRQRLEGVKGIKRFLKVHSLQIVFEGKCRVFGVFGIIAATQRHVAAEGFGGGIFDQDGFVLYDHFAAQVIHYQVGVNQFAHICRNIHIDIFRNQNWFEGFGGGGRRAFHGGCCRLGGSIVGHHKLVKIEQVGLNGNVAGQGLIVK